MTVTSKSILIAIFLLGCFDIWVSRWVICFNLSHLHRENDLLENLQIVLLVVTTITLLVYAFYENRYLRFYSLAGAILCFSFFLRELDMKTLDIPGFFIYLGSGIRKKTLLATLWLCLVGYGAVNYQKIKPHDYRDLMCQKSTFSVFLGGGLLILGGLFDRKIIAASYAQFVEELLELNGYFLIAMGAVLFMRQRKFSSP